MGNIELRGPPLHLLQVEAVRAYNKFNHHR